MIFEKWQVGRVGVEENIELKTLGGIYLSEGHGILP